MSDPIIETPPPIEVEIVTGAATPLSADTPEDLGTAAAGVSMEASRSDHVHAMPTAAEVGADPAGSASAVSSALTTHTGLTTAAHGGIVGDTDARLTDARTPLAHTHPTSQVTGLDLVLTGKVDTASLAQPSGVATLGADGLLAPAQRPPSAGTAQHVNWSTYIGSSAPASASGVGVGFSNGGMNVLYRQCIAPVFLLAKPYTTVSVRTSAAGAGTTWEVGLYAVDADLLPAGLLYTFGSIDMGATPGKLTIPAVFTPPAGWFWVTAKVQAFGGTPTVNSSDLSAQAPAPLGWPSRAATGEAFSGLMQSVGVASGPLADPAPPLGPSSSQAMFATGVPRFYFEMN